MPITTFNLQLAGTISASALGTTPYDLLILETGETSATIGPTLTASEIATLQGQGRTVIGYVNAIVLDDNRQFYVDAGLTDPDTGPFTGVLPSWLDVDAGGVPLAANSFGAYANILDPDWVALVAEQAGQIVDAGYDGVFIDDVGTYFDLAAQRGDITLTQAADGMMALVNAVADEIGPDAFIAINRGADIFDHGTQGTTTASDFRDNVDALLMENQIFTGAWGRAQGDFASDTLWLAVDQANLPGREGGPQVLNSDDYAQLAVDQGVIPLLTPDADYDMVLASPLPASAAPATITGTSGPDLIIGTDGPDLIYGLAGDDTVLGFGGDDTIFGQGGNDILLGGMGRDRIEGRNGDDWIFGGQGRDKLRGGDGEDLILGQAGLDRIFGGNDDDRLSGGGGPDLIDGQGGVNTIWPDAPPSGALTAAEEDWI